MRARLSLYPILALSLLAGALPLRAESPSAPPAETKADLTRRLLTLSGAGDFGEQFIAQLLGTFRQTTPQVPAEFWDEMEKEANAAQLIEMIVPIYERHFSESELRELIAFYETPIGRKLTSVLPQISTESMSAGQEWGARIAERVRKRLEEKGYQPKS